MANKIGSIFKNNKTDGEGMLQMAKDKMVPVPSKSIVPERDVDKPPILETHHLGIDFGGPYGC